MFRYFLCLFLLVSVSFLLVCCYYSRLDWEALQRADAAFRLAASQPETEMKLLFVLEARQNAHRINVFADVVWALLCAIGSVICALGLCWEKRTRGR